MHIRINRVYINNFQIGKVYPEIVASENTYLRSGSAKFTYPRVQRFLKQPQVVFTEESGARWKLTLPNPLYRVHRSD